VALAGGVAIRTVPSSSVDDGRVAFLESRPRGSPPTGWFARVRITQDFTQFPTNVELQLDTYVICTT
jgi:hypothetical protein